MKPNEPEVLWSMNQQFYEGVDEETRTIDLLPYWNDETLLNKKQSPVLHYF